MKVTDFSPSAYSSPEGDIRAVRVGVLWYGEAKDPNTGRWHEYASHCASHCYAIARTLAALDLDEPEPEPDYDPGYDLRDETAGF